MGRSKSKDWDNFLIYDQIPDSNNGFSEKEKKVNFLSDDCESNWEGKNVIVFLLQSTKEELIRISRKLRKKTVKNVTYILGVVLTSSFQDSKILKNNLIFNKTKFQYNFHCYLMLPLRKISCDKFEDLKKEKLTDGFVFYKDYKSEALNPLLVYLSFCVMLELLRDNNELEDNIAHHSVLAPENFNRFSDLLLQISLVLASQGRELDFSSNKELSREMKEVILEIFKQHKDKEYIKKLFIGFLESKKIVLCSDDFDIIKAQYPQYYNNQIPF